MFTDGSGDHSGSLCLCFGDDKFAHDAAVIIIQMADRFIQKYKVERLAECPDKGDALLLSERLRLRSYKP